MVTYIGATVVTRLESLAAEGQIQKEYLGLLSGAGVDQDFYTKNFPITTGVGVTTDVESNVQVYTRVAGGTTWVELNNASETDFAITGATGLVKIKAAKNQAGDAGKAVSINYYTAADVGVGQGATVTFDRDMEEILAQGSADPLELKEGHKHIAGTIDSYYCSRDMIGKFLGVADFYETLASFSFYIFPNKKVSGQPYIKVAGAKFGGGTLRHGLKSIFAVSLNYKGLILSAGTVT